MLQRKNRFRHESLQDTKTIQAYLKAILKGLDQRELVFSDDEGSITLKPQGLLNLKVVASEDVDKNQFELRVSWANHEPQIQQGVLKIGAN